MTADTSRARAGIREELRWVREVYRRNRAGVLIALTLAILAAIVEVGSIALYYPVLAAMTGTPVADGVGGRLLAPLRSLMGVDPELFALLAVLVALVLLRATFLYMSRVVSNHFELGFSLDLKRQFLRRFTEASWDFVIRSKSGSLLNTFSTFTTSASRGLFYLVEFTIDAVSCVAYLTFALSTSPPLALFIAGSVVVVSPVLKRIYWQVKAIVDRNIVVQNRLADKFLDYLRGFKTFKSMSLETLYLRELDRDLAAFTHNERRAYRVQAALQALSEPVFALVGAVFLVVAHYGFAVGMELVVIFFALLGKTYSRLNSLQVNVGKLFRNAPAIRVCQEFDALAAAASESRGGRLLEGRIATLELDRVDVTYPDGTRVFDGLSLALSVEQGLIALVGPSGIGKSTLLDVLAGLLRPSTGIYRINGVDVRALDLIALRRRMGVVPQSPILFSRSIAENISLSDAAGADRERVEAAARLADAHGFITRLAHGYDTVMGDAGASLSLGQIQRISIARALYQRPEILFFDEPTSALDVRATADVMAVIETISEAYPVFLVSHSDEVRRRARTLLVLDGRGVRVATPAVVPGER